MTRNLMACRILEAAEIDLRTVVESMAAAQPEKLETAQHLLTRLVGALGEIEAAARRDPFLPIQANVRGLQNQLGKAEKLNSIALRSIDRRIGLAGIVPGQPVSTLHLEG